MDPSLIEAAKAGNLETVEALLRSGAEADEADEKGWTALTFAAGQGDLAMVRLLVERGADPFKVGRDQRTPQMVALAAGHVEVVKYLCEAEDSRDAERARSLRPERQYARAYHLRDLKQFPGWSEIAAGSSEGSSDEQVVFVHQDFRVTESIWPDEKVIIDQASDSWREFCAQVLGFQVPSDIDLMVSSASSS
ncbi:MAG TPA: ankyrin repeat domain-containing protein [Blastocatellia bacterium]|nr:ankyrin repeat domain-containing protein [Blastocatellia bacterium]